MSIIHKHLRLYGLALLSAATLAGCSSDGTGNDDGTISLALNPVSATVVQGGSSTIAATLTRGNGFTGTVNLTVTGQPTGVTATVGNVVTTGLVTTATVTVNVASTTLVGSYPLVLHGTGAGVAEATATYTLTVSAAPTPAVALSLSAATLSIVQGAATPTTTVTIARTNFTGDVTLSVDNLPTGVTASFNPANPQTTGSSVLTLTVPSGTPTGTTNLTVRATGTGITAATTPLALTVTAPASSFALSLTAPTLSIAQGAATPTTTVNITRTNFTGDVALSVLNLPTGVTASFAPANPQQGSSSVLTLTVAPGAPTGTFTNLSVQGVGTTGTVSTPLSLTITAGTPAGNFTLTTTPATTVNVVQGQNAPVTVNINRTGGNTSNIALTSTSTLPAGMSLAFLPTSTTTNSSVLTVTTTGATPIGSTPIVIRGNTAGLGEQTVNLSINVTAPAGSGNVMLNFASCPAASRPAWLAFMDGTTGTWTPVTGAADIYQFNITQSKGSFAYVLLGTGTSQIIVQHFTQAELTAGSFGLCSAPVANNRVANGTYSNLPVGFVGNISFDGGAALAFGTPAGNFQITNAATGTYDLIGYATLLAGGGSSGDRVFVKRGENPAPAGSFSVPVNFSDPVLSAQAAAASGTLQGLTGSETAVAHGMTFYTGGSSCTSSSLYSLGAAAANFNLYGVPVGLRTSGDMHSIMISASNGTTSSRILIENFVDVPSRAVTPFILPSQLPVPVVTDAGGPYKRPSATVTGIPAELNLSHSLIYFDQTVTGKSGTISASQGWVGGSSVTLVLPNFSGVGTFNNAWAPATGDALGWSFASAGGTFTGVCTAGQRSVTSSRSGTL